MKLAILHLSAYIGVLFITITTCAQAAVPEVAMHTDPWTSQNCEMQVSRNLIATGIATSASSVSAKGIAVYQAAFNPQTGSGSLKKYPLGLDSVAGAMHMPSHAEWDAADILTGLASIPANPSSEFRHIYTSSTNLPSQTISFLWSSLSTAQQAFLNISSINGSVDNLGEKRLDYLRGSRLYELGNVGGIFRARDRVLGALVHSSPVFAGPPPSSLQASDYSAFYNANKDRRSAVYVGASDGMLHAFDALNGEELFAYIPSVLLKNLNGLTQPSGAYRPFVDGSIAVSEARVDQGWMTVLAAGMGGGAQGVFALDVTRPDQFDKGNGVLWEFSDADDADIGNVVGAPLIAKFKTNVVKGVPNYRDFVVVAAGVNNYRDDGAGNFNPQAPSALFLLALDKSKSEPWKLGVNYFKFMIPISDKDMANGLFAPAMVLSNDGAVSYMYSGDLQGNVWRFDFTGGTTWANALGSSSAKPLFTAMDQQGKKQEITQKIQIVYAPNGAYLLLFGTGKFMEASDTNVAHFKTQSFYGVLDMLDGKMVTRDQLVVRKLLPATAIQGALEISGSQLKYGELPQDKKGWYFDFLDSNKIGERSVSGAHVSDGTLFFKTLIPSADPCQAHGGRAYVLSVLNGLPTQTNLAAYLSNTSLLSMPTVVTIVTEQFERDATGKRLVKKKLKVLDPITNADPVENILPTKAITSTTAVSGRLSWREIVNWVELRTSSIKK